MSQTTVNQLIAGIGGAHVTAFFIVLARVTPLFFLAPLFSSKMIPARVRAIVAVAHRDASDRIGRRRRAPVPSLRPEGLCTG